MSRTLRLGAFFLAILAVFPLFSQTYTGSIAGRVTDASGAAVPEVAIAVTDVNTNAVTRTITNSVGDYLVSFLKPGTYTVTFSKSGFKEQVQQGLALQINQQLRIDAGMQVGAVSDKVEVSASAELINYTSPEIGHVVGEEQLMNIPLVATNSRGRATVLLSKLVPGVT